MDFRHSIQRFKPGDILMLWENENFRKNHELIQEINDGDCFICCNLSQLTPDSEIIDNRKNLTFIDCNLTNIKQNKSFKVNRCNTSKNEYQEIIDEFGKPKTVFKNNLGKNIHLEIDQDARKEFFASNKNNFKNKLLKSKYKKEISNG